MVYINDWTTLQINVFQDKLIIITAQKTMQTSWYYKICAYSNSLNVLLIIFF